jgi:hypothetical protein
LPFFVWRSSASRVALPIRMPLLMPLMLVAERRLSLMRLAFKRQKVQRDCNNRECRNDLDAIEKFIQTCHMIAYVTGLKLVL